MQPQINNIHLVLAFIGFLFVSLKAKIQQLFLIG